MHRTPLSPKYPSRPNLRVVGTKGAPAEGRAVADGYTPLGDSRQPRVGYRLKLGLA